MNAWTRRTRAQQLCWVMCVSHPMAAVLRLVIVLAPFVVFPLALAVPWYPGLYVALAGFVAFLLTGSERFRLWGAERYGYGGNPDDEFSSSLYYERAAMQPLSAEPRLRQSGLADRLA